jgi:hypothetical protein
MVKKVKKLLNPEQEDRMYELNKEVERLKQELKEK